MNRRFEEPPDKVSARRRLIRGAFSAPAVLTLCSGSAFAALSNQRCVANQVNGTRTYPDVGPADTWVRVQRYKLNGNKFYVRGQDIVALRGTSTTISSYITATQWQEATSPYAILSGPPGNGNNTPQVDTGNFVAVRVNADGNIVGIVGDGTGSTSAVANSCWASFTAAG
ncbi:MAG: hypothetical protein ABIQ60_16265 [Burkholderiaceae bacterium]